MKSIFSNMGSGKAEDVKELMAYEGEVWMRFYGGFVYFLPEDFVMNKRVKRPPDNPN